MAEDNKPEETKSKSLIDRVTAFLQNPDAQKSLLSLVEITGGAGLSQAEKEKMVAEFNENDKKRLAKEQELLEKLKKNEGKIQQNDELIAASRAAVQKLEQHIAELDARIAQLDQDFEKLKNEGEDLDEQAADLKKKLGME